MLSNQLEFVPMHSTRGLSSSSLILFPFLLKLEQRLICGPFRALLLSKEEHCHQSGTIRIHENYINIL